MKVFLITICILTLAGTHYSSYAQPNEFEFPDSRMGSFAKVWFKSINSHDLTTFKSATTDREWDEFLETLIAFSKNKGGLTPYSISYETEDFISIYSKENQGRWVKVNLGLSPRNIITDMTIKKSVKAVNYSIQFSLTETHISDIISSITEELVTNYVDPTVRLEYSDSLIKRYRSGAYDHIIQGDLLAERLTSDLVAISNDKHLQVLPPSLLNEVIMRFGEDEPEDTDTIDHDVLTENPISNEIIDDSIGYIALERFVDSKEAKESTIKAFEALEHCSNIIIDLTNSGGGDGEAVNHLLSYFIDASSTSDKELLSAIKNNQLNASFVTKPLFVLTSEQTISAGEAFTYFLKRAQRATIVGEQTAGAGYRVNVFDLAHGFYLVNSTHTPFSLEEGKGWQGVGVAPDILTSNNNALEKVKSIIAIY